MQDEVRKELEEMGSILGRKKYQKEFEVPDGYFQNMQDKVISTVNGEQKSKSKLFKLRKLIYASAAIIILVLGSLITLRNYTTPKNGFKNIDSEVIYAYLNDNLDEITLQQLISQELDFEAIVANENTDEVQKYLENHLEDLQLEELEEMFKINEL
jgi:hypothetical protein